MSRVKSRRRSAGDQPELDQEPGDRRLQARRAGEPGPERDIAGDDRLEARFERPGTNPSNAQQTPRTYRVQVPASVGSMASSGKASAWSKLTESNRASRPSARRPDDDRRAVDRRGHDQAAVVVGVVAQQLDPPGGPAHAAGSPPNRSANAARAWANRASTGRVMSVGSGAGLQSASGIRP